ncbi:MAG TPA: hypothetical protein VK936_08805 [Longimicrobiales bacterium]|nr:hypothetical protein [Longimicrobiales bacterium]
MMRAADGAGSVAMLAADAGRMLAVAILLTLLAACGEAPPPAVPSPEDVASMDDAAPAAELPAYQALRDSVVDQPAHTQVERRLIVEDTVENAALEALLRAEFDAIMSSGPYAHREHPTHVYIRIYDSEVRSRRPALWRAMLRYGPGSEEPAIQTENAVLERQQAG